MTTKNERHAIEFIVFILLIVVFLSLTVFSEHWLGVITRHPFGSDFKIYYDASTRAATGENPYLPYNIGSSFVNHPFVLSFVSIFALAQNGNMIAWAVASIIAYLFVIGLVFKLIQNDIEDYKKEHNHHNIVLWLLLITFLFFAPFFETIHIGQINIFVLLSISLLAYFSEKNKSIPAGFFLALAIVLKTSPIILILYFLADRKYRLLISCAISLIIFSVIPAVQFSPLILVKFLNILPMISSEIHPTNYNQSILSLAFRFFQFTGIGGLETALIVGHKILMMVVLGLILIPTLFRQSTKKSKQWFFGLLITTMVLFSPLVWYHHSIYLIFPMALLSLFSSGKYINIGIGLLFLMQIERLFENYVFNFPLPVAIAEYTLLGLGIWIYIKEFGPVKINTPQFLPKSWSMGQNN